MLDGATLARAIAATFARREMALPTQPRGFGAEAGKLHQWHAFLNKSRISAGTLTETVSLLHSLLWPASQVAARASNANATWHAHRLRWT